MAVVAARPSARVSVMFDRVGHQSSTRRSATYFVLALFSIGATSFLYFAVVRHLFADRGSDWLGLRIALSYVTWAAGILLTAVLVRRAREEWDRGRGNSREPNGAGAAFKKDAMLSLLFYLVPLALVLLLSLLALFFDLSVSST